MIDKVRAKVSEYHELQKKLVDPAVYGNPKEVAVVAKRSKDLEPLVAKYGEYQKCEQALKEEESLRGGDSELLKLAAEEADAARSRMPVLLEEMKRYLVPRNPDDERSVILEVRAGTGGNEAALFAAEQLKMYLKYAQSKGWTAELIDTSAADAGGVKEASARIEGVGAYGDLKYESGVHRVQRIPVTEAKGRIHTSTTTVAILPEAEETDVVIRGEDLKIDTFRSGGAGGQHVNKTESAVRITHLPTGTVVVCQSERSQIKNRALAMSILRSRIYADNQERKARERSSMRSNQVGSGDRSEKIRTYNFPQDRITDHRANVNFSNIPAIMEGHLDDIVAALRKWEEEEALKSL